MKLILTSLIAVFLCVTNIYAQRVSSDLFSPNSAPETSMSEVFESQVKDPVFLKVSKNELSKIFSERNSEIKINIPVTLRNVSSNFVLELKKFDITTPETRIVKKTVSGEEDMQLHNCIVSYMGKVKDKDNSFVTITFTQDRVMGIITSGNETYTLGTTDENNPANDNYILFQESLRKVKRNFVCGSETMEIPDRIKAMMKQYTPGKDNMTSTFLKAQIAVDVDFATYNSYGGNTTNATAWAMAHMAAVSATYVKEINCQLIVSYLRIWTTQDPYTSTSGSTMLDQFRFDWIATQSGVPRVVAHLLSRRQNLDVAGIAYLGVLCSTNLGYGLSATLTGAAPNLPNYTYDVETTAHEIGHNFGSPHTHNCGWVGGPIDTCVEIEGGCYSGPLHPTVGTIMSYCDISGGGSVIMTFGSQPGTLIRNNAESAGCITANNLPILLVLPKGGETFRTGNTAAIWWGSNSSGNINIEYSTNNGTSWSVLQNNVPAQQRSLNWVVPYIGSTTQAKVRIYNASNPSEADTSDTPFRIILNLNSFSLSSPGQLTQLAVNPNAVNSYQTFRWGSAGTHPTIKYNWKIKRSGGQDRLFQSSNNGSDSSITLRYSLLDSIRASFNAGDSILTIWSATAYSGIDSATSNSLILILKRGTVGISQISSSVPSVFSLFNNYPNPFNPSTNIKFDIPKSSFVKLSVYDSRGALVKELVNETLQAGTYNYSFDAAEFSSGVYFYRIDAGSFTDTKRMVLLK
ncbi:MAG: T9SS type A sorting domain-containing protein [Ignavibacteria bacterium]|nr:T9SS type A sorting domain-containing protein [Ignavibacteria bacterium]